VNRESGIQYRTPNAKKLRTDNSRASASMRGEEENKRSRHNAKNAEKGVDATVQGRGVRIGFGWHESEN